MPYSWTSLNGGKYWDGIHTITIDFEGKISGTARECTVKGNNTERRIYQVSNESFSKGIEFQLKLQRDDEDVFMILTGKQSLTGNGEKKRIAVVGTQTIVDKNTKTVKETGQFHWEMQPHVY